MIQRLKIFENSLHFAHNFQLSSFNFQLFFVPLSFEWQKILTYTTKE